ncbi:MAG: translation initiation factor IF-3 [Firmicutes bacterium]|nr:translation initiation factor IF-3 [Bacillota bacterium]
MPVRVADNRPFFGREVKSITKEFRVNEEIRAREIRVVDPEGKQLGIMSAREALRLAEELQLDLVEVAPQARPPVCRLMDFGRYKYEQSKREREARKRQRSVELKEIKFRPRIEEHDFRVKLRNATRFLNDGDKVKVTIIFRGREIVHTQLGEQLMNRLASELAELATVERAPRLEGRQMVMILAPRKSERSAAHAENENPSRGGQTVS